MTLHTLSMAAADGLDAPCVRHPRLGFAGLGEWNRVAGDHEPFVHGVC
jgi:hypothetical protein